MRRAPVRPPKGSKPTRPTTIEYHRELEERLAAMTLLYTWEQYQELPGDIGWVGNTGVNSKDYVIATYRASVTIKKEMGG